MLIKSVAASFFDTTKKSFSKLLSQENFFAPPSESCYFNFASFRHRWPLKNPLGEKNHGKKEKFRLILKEKLFLKDIVYSSRKSQMLEAAFLFTFSFFFSIISSAYTILRWIDRWPHRKAAHTCTIGQPDLLGMRVTYMYTYDLIRLY